MTGNFRVYYHVSGEGVLQRDFDSRILAVLFRLFHWAGWISNGMQTQAQIKAVQELRDSHVPDNSLTDGRY